MQHLITPLFMARAQATLWSVLWVCVMISPAYAQHTPEMVQPALAWVEQTLAQAQGQGLPALKMSITVGQLDPRLQLAPCKQMEPSLPVGSRLWGKTRVVLKCVDGVAKWQVFLPVQVKAMGPAWVLRRDVPAGVSLREEDLMMTDVDWADDPNPVVAQPQVWATQLTARALTTGQVLRHHLLRPAQVFQPGSLVRVMAQGGGFQVSADGQALSAGVVGQAVKVRMDNGRVMTGTVVDARTVKVDI